MKRRQSSTERSAESADQIAGRIGRKLRALRASTSAYTGPPEAKFDVLDVRIVWIAKPDACAECKTYADGSPYRRGTLKHWPGLTSCGNRCRCHIAAFEPDWNAAFDGEPTGRSEA
jgi:hypothetical protein